MRHRLVAICLVAFISSGCQKDAGGDAASAPTPSEEAAPTAEGDAPARPADDAPAARAAADSAPAQKGAAGDTLTLGALHEAFSASKGDWMDREVTVEAVYFTSMRSAEGQLESIQIKSDRESASITTCKFSDETRPDPVPKLTQFKAITVRGKVGQRWGQPTLSGCRIVE